MVSVKTLDRSCNYYADTNITNSLDHGDILISVFLDLKKAFHTVLGPLLFIIYMNDIINVSNILYTILYTDDTCAVLRGNDFTDLIKLLHTELCKLSIWLRSNKLSLNKNKTLYLLFHRERIKPVKISMEMNGSIINRVNSIIYLGVIIDHKLNWMEHIAYVKKSVQDIFYVEEALSIYVIPSCRIICFIA